jgi:cobalt-zinc-cadmium efflux system membrane fusion protein
VFPFPSLSVRSTMWLKRFLTPVVTLAVLAAAGFAAYHTRERWLPYVFPPQAETKAGGHDDHDHDHDKHDHGHADRVKLPPQAQLNLKLDVAAPVPREYWRTLLIPGVVVDRPGESDRGVPSRVAGVVTDIRAKPGDTLKAGDPLFTLQLVSEFLQSAQTDLAKTARELEFATAKRDRVAELVRKGTQSGTTLIEEENQVKRLTTQVQAYRRQLQVFGLTPAQVDRAEKGDVITQVTVLAPPRAAPPPEVAAPSAGSTAAPPPPDVYEVQELKVTLGEQVQAGQTLCVLANHQRLFVEGRAFKSEADALAAIAERKVPVSAEFADETAGVWPPQGPLLIHHLSNQVDPATRTFGFYLPLDNQPRTYTQDGKTNLVWRYRPGQRVRLRVPVEKLGTPGRGGQAEVLPFVFPVGAVVREGPEAFVFVQSGDVFVRKPVRVLYEDRTEVVVANDGSVSEAEFVVRNQAAAINRALKAAAAGGGHDHDHEH